MNNLLLGGQKCTDYVDIQQDGDGQYGQNRTGIIPRLNFTCSGRITSIRARLTSNGNRNNYPFIQVWRATSDGSTLYNKIDEVQLSDDQVTGSGNFQTANITLTGNNTIEVQLGDVVGYYHPPDARYQMREIDTDGYYLYRFDGSPAPDSVNLTENDLVVNYRQPLLQFTIGM